MNRNNFYKGFRRYRWLVNHTFDDSPDMAHGKHRKFFQEIHLKSSHLGDPRSHKLRMMIWEYKRRKDEEHRQAIRESFKVSYERNGVTVTTYQPPKNLYPEKNIVRGCIEKLPEDVRPLDIPELIDPLKSFT